MAKSKIQFQAGMSFDNFMAEYGTEEQCERAVYEMKWGEGFSCPKCGYESCCMIRSGERTLYQCSKCRHQASVKADTIFESTKLPLRKWFQGMYFLTQGKQGISALDLKRKLGVNYNTAYLMKMKLMSVMKDREETKQLSGTVEMDDAYMGGENRGGKRGRGSENKSPFIAAVSKIEGRPMKAKLMMISSFCKEAVEELMNKHFVAGETEFITDGLNCFSGIDQTKFKHTSFVVSAEKGRKSVDMEEFNWVNTILGNLKNFLRGTFHAIDSAHGQKYLAEFQYRFNRRTDLPSMMPRLLFSCVKSYPKPWRILKIA